MRMLEMMYSSRSVCLKGRMTVGLGKCLQLRTWLFRKDGFVTVSVSVCISTHEILRELVHDVYAINFAQWNFDDEILYIKRVQKDW